MDGCSRRWNYHLRSANVLHTVAFILSPEQHLLGSSQKVIEALQSSFAHVANVAFIDIDQSMDFNLYRSMVEILTGLSSQPHRERLLYLCSLVIELVSDFYSMNSIYQLATYDWIELRGAKISGDTTSNILLFVADQERDYERTWLPVEQDDEDGRDGLNIVITGSYVWKSKYDVSGLDATGKGHIMAKDVRIAWLELINDNTRHLTLEETMALLEHLSQFDEDRIQAAFIWLLQEYEPDMSLSPAPSVWTFDYAVGSPLIGRVLACYSGLGDFASGDASSGEDSEADDEYTEDQDRDDDSCGNDGTSDELSEDEP